MMIYERVHTIKTKRLISKYSINGLQRSRYEFQRNLRNISAAVIPAATSSRTKKALQNFYSAFHNKAAYLQPEASGFFYRYITEYGDISKVVCFFDNPAPSTISA